MTGLAITIVGAALINKSNGTNLALFLGFVLSIIGIIVCIATGG